MAPRAGCMASAAAALFASAGERIPSSKHRLCDRPNFSDAAGWPRDINLPSKGGWRRALSGYTYGPSPVRGAPKYTMASSSPSSSS